MLLRPLVILSVLATAFQGSAAGRAAAIPEQRDLINGRAGGGMRQLPVGRRTPLRITIADGQRFKGQFAGGWDGIPIGSEVVWLEPELVAARAPLARPALAQGGPSAAASSHAAATAPVAPAVATRATALATPVNGPNHDGRGRGPRQPP